MPETRTIGTLAFQRLGSAWYCRTVIATPATAVIVEVRRVFGADYSVEVMLGESCRKAADEREIGAALLCRSSLLASAHRIPEAALGKAVGHVLDHAVDRLMPPQPEQVVEEPVAAPRFDPASTRPRPLRVGSFKHREAARAGFRGLAAIGDAVARGMVLEALFWYDGPEVPALRGAIYAAIPGTCVVAFDCAVKRGEVTGPGWVLDVPCTGQCPKLRVVGWRAESAIGDRGTWIEGVLDCGVA